MSTPRRLDNWLQTFLDWTFPVSEAPESLLTWTGLFCLSAVMKRKIKFSREWTVKYDIWPTAYIMFVGPPGAVKKSTSAGYAEELLLGYNEKVLGPAAKVNFGPTSGSAAAIVVEMSKTVDGSLTLIAGEFGNIVKTMPVETYDFFTKMFDNDPTYKHSTIGRGLDTVLDPSLCLLGCTTPDWIELNSGYITGGGFAARTIFIFEYKARQYGLFWKERAESLGLTQDKLRSMKEDLIHDLEIIGDIQGEARPESLELGRDMDKWYQEYMPKPAEKGTETFKARKHIHALRTAYCLSLCESNDLVITRKHWDKSLVLIEEVERKLVRGLGSIGKNPDAVAMYDVLDYVVSNGPVTKGKVLRHFFNDLAQEKIESILQILQLSGEIEHITADDSFRKSRKK